MAQSKKPTWIRFARVNWIALGESRFAQRRAVVAAFRADEIAGATYVVRYRLKRWAPETGFVANGSRGHLHLEAEWGVIP
jgi:hypothetical protein